jgi:hypothetical protein
MIYKFEDYLHMEPRLLEILRDAKKMEREGGDRFCGLGAWHGFSPEVDPALSLKARVSALVGYERPGPEDDPLGTSAAYDTVGFGIRDAMKCGPKCPCKQPLPDDDDDEDY